MSLRPFTFVVVILAAHLPSAGAQGGVTRYCTPGMAGSQISASGSASFTVNGGSGDFVLHADNVGPTAPGLFLFGSNAIAPAPFGNGFRCVGGTVFRLPVVTPAAGTGTSSFALDWLAPGPASLITPGSTWNFQFWFRSGATFDLSDALSVQFIPPSLVTGSSTVAQGHVSGHPLASDQAGGILLVENDAQWLTLWSQHDASSSPLPPPAVDFSQDVVVAVFAGWRPSSGYDIAVRRLELSVATLDAFTVERAPGAGCGVLAVITHPFHFVRVPRVDHVQLGSWTRGIDTSDCP